MSHTCCHAASITLLVRLLGVLKSRHCTPSIGPLARAVGMDSADGPVGPRDADHEWDGCEMRVGVVGGWCVEVLFGLDQLDVKSV